MKFVATYRMQVEVQKVFEAEDFANAAAQALAVAGGMGLDPVGDPQVYDTPVLHEVRRHEDEEDTALLKAQHAAPPKKRKSGRPKADKPAKVALAVRKCVICGEEFTPKQQRSEVCSPKCRNQKKYQDRKANAASGQ